MKKTLLICIMCLVTALCLCLSACSPKHTHDFSSGVYKSTATGHSQKCKDDDTYGPEEPHTFGEDGKCTVCDYEHTHSFTSDVFEKSDAGHKRKCTDCNQYGEIEKHTFDANNKCTVCGYEKKEPSAHEHNLKKVDKKDPTCTEKGNIEYYTCDGKDCSGKYFNEKGEELKEEDVIIAAKGHDFTSGQYEQSKTGHRQKCKNCDTYEENETKHTFENGVCKDCHYKENSEDLDLPDNLNGEYKNVNGATITIKDTKVTVKMSDQVQKPNEYTITGYDDEGNITVEPDIDLGGGEQGKITLIFNEENETLTAGYLGTFYKVQTFELPEDLDGTYVNEEEEEIVVDKANKTVKVDSKDYIIIYYDDEEKSLTLFGKTDGTIIEMTYDEENDKLTYDDVDYTKKTEEEPELPEKLDGVYKDEHEATITISGTSFDLKMSSQAQTTHHKITGYDKATGKLTLDPPLDLGGGQAIVTFHENDETIDVSTLAGFTFKKVKEEEPEKPELPDDINGVYKNVNSGGYMLVLDKKTIFVEGGTADDHTCEVKEYTFEDDTYNLEITCTDHKDTTENWTYNKDEKTITNSTWGTFTEYSPELPEELSGEYTSGSGFATYTINVEDDILKLGSGYGSPDVFTIVEYNESDGKISGIRHNNGYFKTFTYNKDADTIKDDFEDRTFTKVVETPPLELPKELNGAYYTQDGNSEIDVEVEAFDYYADVYDDYPTYYTITDYNGGKGSLESDEGEKETFEYDEKTDTITFKNKQYKKDWSDPAPQKAEAPSWMIGTWDNGGPVYSMQYLVIDKTTVKKYRGNTSGVASSTFDIVSVSEGTMTLNCTSGGMTGAHIDWTEPKHDTIMFMAFDNYGTPQNISLVNKTGGVEETPDEVTVPSWLIGNWESTGANNKQFLVIEKSKVTKYRTSIGSSNPTVMTVVSVSDNEIELKLEDQRNAQITWSNQTQITFKGDNLGEFTLNKMVESSVELPSWLNGTFYADDFSYYFTFDSTGIIRSPIMGSDPESKWEAVSLVDNVLTIKKVDSEDTMELQLNDTDQNFTVDGATYAKMG